MILESVSINSSLTFGLDSDYYYKWIEPSFYILLQRLQDLYTLATIHLYPILSYTTTTNLQSCSQYCEFRWIHTSPSALFNTRHFHSTKRDHYPLEYFSGNQKCYKWNLKSNDKGNWDPYWLDLSYRIRNRWVEDREWTFKDLQHWSEPYCQGTRQSSPLSSVKIFKPTGVR